MRRVHRREQAEQPPAVAPQPRRLRAAGSAPIVLIAPVARGRSSLPAQRSASQQGSARHMVFAAGGRGAASGCSKP